MEGFVIDEKGAYVKAAIVKLYKKTLDADRRDPADEAETEAITYAETDGEGRFLVQDLDPGEKYVIEIHVNGTDPASAGGKADPDSDDRRDRPDDGILEEEICENADDQEDDAFDRIEEKNIVGSMTAKVYIDSTTSEKVSINNLSCKPTVDLKEKAYLKKTNLW